MILTSTNEVNFARLWQWRQELPTIKAFQRGHLFGVVNLDGMFKEKITILIVHFCMFLVTSEDMVNML
jgi:hypothetical protein